MSLEASFPGGARALGHFLHDVPVELIRLLGTFGPHQCLELGGTPLVDGIDDRSHWNAPVLTIDAVGVGKLGGKHAVGVRALTKALREPV